MVRARGGLIIRLDVIDKTQVKNFLLRAVELFGTEQIVGFEQNFPADDVFLGFSQPLDVNVSDINFLAFGDFKNKGDLRNPTRTLSE